MREVVLILLLTTGCGLIFQESEVTDRGEAPRAEEAADRLPGGLGTLHQEEVSMRLRRGELEVMVTPLDEEITRTTAPDTWSRLSALADLHRTELRNRTGADQVRLFLVALHSESEAVAFEPDDLTLVSRGLRFRPLEIQGLTPGWDRHRVGPRETLLAIYAFPTDIDLERQVEVEYREVRSRDWEEILPRIQLEQGRVRARAGGDY